MKKPISKISTEIRNISFVLSVWGHAYCHCHEGNYFIVRQIWIVQRWNIMSVRKAYAQDTKATMPRIITTIILLVKLTHIIL